MNPETTRILREILLGFTIEIFMLSLMILMAAFLLHVAVTVIRRRPLPRVDGWWWVLVGSLVTIVIAFWQVAILQ